MSDDPVAPGTKPPVDGGEKIELEGLQRWLKALFDRTTLGRMFNRHVESVNLLREQGEVLVRRVDDVTGRLEGRLDGVEERLDGLEGSVRRGQTELADLREGRVAVQEGRLDGVEEALASVTGDVQRLRDEVVPAMVGRSDALLERLYAEIDEVGSLTERILRREPLPVATGTTGDGADLYRALADIQPGLLKAFRGPESEIRHRLEHYLEPLRECPPVLDLGCGRGELLLMLREAGIEAAGIEGDPAVAQATRRRGLDVTEGDVLEALRNRPDDSCGAVTAIHLFEHLEPAVLAAVLAEIRRVLTAGGQLIIECPNPHSLRVGAALFWIDPTHRRPLMPETLRLFLTGGGFDVAKTELLHPFPAEQLFTGNIADDTLARRLDDLVNGPRDFAVWATKSDDESS
ncbi:MAG: methyltransferase domain-containing protein [Thermoanaerobaculales bacterium]|jgi:O-antigen chain-terminating methyltransferase|nr:methyltransferase domain-containing protein [Thermoanaerobaculales bacterium]